MTICALTLTIFATIALTENTLRSLELGSVSYYPSRTPIWLPQACLSASWLLLCVGLISRLLRLIFNLPGKANREGLVE